MNRRGFFGTIVAAIGWLKARPNLDAPVTGRRERVDIYDDLDDLNTWTWDPPGAHEIELLHDGGAMHLVGTGNTTWFIADKPYVMTGLRWLSTDVIPSISVNGSPYGGVEGIPLSKGDVLSVRLSPPGPRASGSQAVLYNLTIPPGYTSNS